MRPGLILVSTAMVAMFMSQRASAETFRVGPAEKLATISQVANTLVPGDVVEITGDIRDSAILTRDGTATKPITIRGVLRAERDPIVRPRISPTERGEIALWCQGNWNVIENLDFDGKSARAAKQTDGVYHDCGDLLVRNCRFHHFNFKAICGSATSGSITIQFCEFECCGPSGGGKAVDVWSWTPGAVMRVEHCYFHRGLEECLLKSHCTRNVIRYNWFEDAPDRELKVIDRIGGYTPDRPKDVYPMHSDIVGNVFIQGVGPGARFSIFNLGGSATESPGTEGDFNIAHNLFVMDRYGAPRTDPPAYVQIHGNVDHVRMYNNVFLQLGGSDNMVYLRDSGWNTPETRDFITRRGSPDPIVEGSNNWIFERSAGIPATFKNTLRGLNPKLVDLLNGDYRPRKDSPLAGAGMWPLPKGQIVDLVPEYEPQRGIPADLKPKVRRKVTPPSIGPFEVRE